MSMKNIVKLALPFFKTYIKFYKQKNRQLGELRVQYLYYLLNLVIFFAIYEFYFVFN